MPTKQLSLPQLRSIIHTAVREELTGLFEDPDFGLYLRDSVVKRLRQSQRSKKAGHVVSAEEVIARLKLRV